jgi:hypothetical protein
MFRIVFFGLSIFICMGSLGNAGIINGDFDSPIDVGWQSFLNGRATCSIANSSDVLHPHYANLDASTLVFIDSSSQLTQQITVKAGDKLTFDYQYIFVGDASSSGYCTVGAYHTVFPELSESLPSLEKTSGTTWASFSYTFNPYYGDTTYSLDFRSFVPQQTSSTDCTLHIDHVQLTSVPEPSCLFLLSICALMLLPWRRPRNPNYQAFGVIP